MARDADETVARVLEIAEAAIDDLKHLLGGAATVEDLRHLWNRLLQPENEGEAGGGEGLTPTDRIASELIMAALVAIAAGSGAPTPATSETRGEMSERSTDLDPALLEAAEAHAVSAATARSAWLAGQAGMAPLEAELNRAKVRFGNAIRRLYQAGGSVSSIARSMGMSEEAVHRVVGTPATDEYQPVLACNFCNRKRNHLIAGPGVYICSECIEAAQAAGAARGEESTPMLREQVDSRNPCSFCSKRPGQVHFVVAVETARICDECLDLCAEILGELDV